MTVNDITFRSQQFTEGARQFQDQRRDQANASIGNTIQGFGNQLVDMQRYEREFQARQMAMQQELAMQQADASMRLALQQQELQSNQYKLQQMAQIDAVDMGKLQIDSARLDYEMRKYEFEERKKMAEPEADAKRKEAFARVLSSFGGARGAIAAGYNPNPESLSFSRFASDAEKARALEAVDQLYGSSGGVDQLTDDRRNLTGLISSLSKIDDMLLETSDPQKRTQLEGARDAIQAQLDQVGSRYRGGEKKGAGESAPSPLSKTDQAKVADIAGMIRSPEAVPDYINRLAQGGGIDASYKGMNAQSADNVSRWLVANKAAIHQRLTQRRASGRAWAGSSPDDTITRLAGIIKNRSAPERQAIVAMLVEAGVLSAEEAGL